MLLAPLALSCGEPPPVEDTTRSPEIVAPPPVPPEPEPTVDDAPLLPAAGVVYPETQVRLVQDDPADAVLLADVETCASCHPGIYETWRSSAHARASFDNPWYRQAVDAFRRDVSAESSRFCAGCHDPVLLIADAMHEPVHADDPRAHAGVTCMVCHGTQSVRADGTGSYTLRTSPVPLPDPADEDEVREHVAALTPDPLRTSALCGGCHRGFLGPHMGNPHHLPGLDNLTPFRRSGFAGSRATRVDEPVDEQNCQGCHMRMTETDAREYARDERGQIHSHRFVGGHTALGAATNEAQHLADTRALLREAARVDIAEARSQRRRRRWFVPDGAPVRAGERIELSVVVRNIGAAHRLVGGTLDAQDTWLEVELHDATGTTLAVAGADHARHPERADPTAHLLMAALVGEDAEPRLSHRVHDFRAKVLDRSIGPRDAAVVRYAVTLPRGIQFPVEVRARLRHRRHNATLHRQACRSQRSARGRAFSRQSERFGNTPIDACAAQPISELADASVWMGRDSDGHEASGGATDPLWRRHFDHALGLIGDVQEHLDDARPVLDAAEEQAPDEHARAMVIGQRARLEARQGRLDQAVAELARARALIGEHPALDRSEGDAYAQVWRWEEAAAAYRRAAEGAPLDDSRWADLARALGSAGQDLRALDAAVTGLRLAPRHETLLRTQSLAIEALGRDGAEPAREAYLAHRVVDELPRLRLECGQADPWCLRERVPVHTHEMRIVQSISPDSGGGGD